jgi:hypothetical protein
MLYLAMLVTNNYLFKSLIILLLYLIMPTIDLIYANLVTGILAVCGALLLIFDYWLIFYSLRFIIISVISGAWLAQHLAG